MHLARDIWKKQGTRLGGSCIKLYPCSYTLKEILRDRLELWSNQVKSTLPFIMQGQERHHLYAEAMITTFHCWNKAVTRCIFKYFWTQSWCARHWYYGTLTWSKYRLLPTFIKDKYRWLLSITKHPPISTMMTMSQGSNDHSSKTRVVFIIFF